MTATAILFDPLVPLPVLIALAVLAALAVTLALWRGLSGWWLRAAAALALLAAMAGPSRQDETRAALSDIVIAVVDESASQRLGDRPARAEAALAALRAEIAALPDTELRVVRVADAPGDQGSLVLSALAEALAAEPRARIAGAVLITDGHAHDLDAAPALPAPLHVILTGRPDDWDRRLVVRTAPAFAIIGEEVQLVLAIEDQGAVPAAAATGLAELTVRVDGGEAQTFAVPVGQDLTVPVTLDHGGLNVLQFSLAPMAGEMTDRNNVAVVQINGVRDRLRVLLVSGEPHAGERTWRNLLKSDASVDLVHFTILRPPEKQDGVPVNELSLIAFPTRELFVDKIEEFDLIIFDRYRRRGILPSLYIDNVRDYVRRGGAVLVAAGPEFGSADSLYRSSLSEILPAAPTGRVVEEGFLPTITDLGRRHPVTAGLDDAPRADDEAAPWGRWFRLIELEPLRGQVAMTGAGGRPLLVLDRVGEGRVALLASDHAWLWGRGFEGGGPQLELLRRVAHWSMAEPELEEEALTATASGQEVTITRRTLTDGPHAVTITHPDGSETALDVAETAPGRFSANWSAPDMGLYRLAEGEIVRVVAVGPATPREYVETVATGRHLADLVAATAGGIVAPGAGAPDVRQVGPGRVAAGRGWIGITPRGAHLTTDITLHPLLPAWLFLLLAAALAVGAWLWEGRRGTARASRAA